MRACKACASEKGPNLAQIPAFGLRSSKKSVNFVEESRQWPRMGTAAMPTPARGPDRSNYSTGGYQARQNLYKPGFALRVPIRFRLARPRSGLARPSGAGHGGTVRNKTSKSRKSAEDPHSSVIQNRQICLTFSRHSSTLKVGEERPILPSPKSPTSTSQVH